MACKAVSAVLLLLVLATGCAKQDPTRKAAQDAEDVAMVESMSREPLRPIIPDPITSVDVARYGLDRSSVPSPRGSPRIGRPRRSEAGGGPAGAA